MSSQPKICVAVRKRPIGDDKDVVQTSSPHLLVNEPKIKYDLTPYTERHQFCFDEVFDDKCANREVYIRCAQPLIDTVFTKGNATCFAYGQTGSGKTHTMLGKGDEPGLYACAAHDLFQRCEPKGLDVFASFYEIYGRKLFDLLNNRAKLVCREDGNQVINICGLTEHQVGNVEELLRIIASGSAYRAAGATSANAESSRSHAVLQLEVRERGSPKTFGKISFIDLAGNERGSDTYDADRKTRMEGAEINKSLLALKECIRALGMGKSHVPFRGSILTEVLRDSFLGNSRTTMIATISPASSNCEHSLNTLRYTSRVKEIGGGGKAPPLPAELKQMPQEAVQRPNQRGRPSPAPQNDQYSAMAARVAAQAGGGGGGGQQQQQLQQGQQQRPAPFLSEEQQQSGDGQQQQQRKPYVNNRRQQQQQPERPEWISDFAQQPQQPLHPDPQVAGIVQSHLNDLDEIEAEVDDEDDDDDGGLNDMLDDPNGGGNGHGGYEDNNQQKQALRSSARKVKAVHAHIVSAIRKAEEDISKSHRKHIDLKMRLMKEEVEALRRLDDGKGSVDDYAAKVESLLQREAKELQNMKDQIAKLQAYLREEEVLSKTLTPAPKQQGKPQGRR